MWHVQSYIHNIFASFFGILQVRNNRIIVYWHSFAIFHPRRVNRPRSSSCCRADLPTSPSRERDVDLTGERSSVSPSSGNVNIKKVASSYFLIVCDVKLCHVWQSVHVSSAQIDQLFRATQWMWVVLGEMRSEFLQSETLMTHSQASLMANITLVF